MNGMSREETAASRAGTTDGVRRYRGFVNQMAKLTIWTLAVVILLAVGLEAIRFFTASPEDPVYRGVHLSECLPVRDWQAKASPVAPEDFHNFQPDPARYLADVIERNHAIGFTMFGNWLPPSFPLGMRLQKIRDHSRQQFYGALEALPWLGPAGEPALPVLFPLLDDSDSNIRWTAANAINATGPKTWPKVIEKLKRGSAPARAALLRTLPSRFTVRAEPQMERDVDLCWELLIPACRDPNPDVQLAALEALDSQRQYVTYITPLTEQIGPAVLYCLEHGRSRVRVQAAYTLPKFDHGVRDAIPAMERAASDPDPELREAAKYGLAKLKKDLPVR